MLEFSGFYFFLIGMHRSKGIFTNELLRDNDRILIVISVPWHKCNHNIFTDRKLTLIHVCTIGNNLLSLNFITKFDNWCLRKGSILIGSHIFFKWIMVYKYTRIIFTHNINIFSIYFFNCTCSLSFHTLPCITTHNRFHTCTDNRCICFKKRYRLALHV